jgi:hypothetical protein
MASDLAADFETATIRVHGDFIAWIRGREQKTEVSRQYMILCAEFNALGPARMEMPLAHLEYLEAVISFRYSGELSDQQEKFLDRCNPAKAVDWDDLDCDDIEALPYYVPEIFRP